MQRVEVKKNYSFIDEDKRIKKFKKGDMLDQRGDYLHREDGLKISVEKAQYYPQHFKFLKK